MKNENSRSTILVISVGFLVLHLLFSWQWAAIVSLIIGIIGIISDTISKIIEKAWMGLAGIFGYIIPPIMLGIVFYLILFPIAFISKIFRKDPLMLSNIYNTHFVTIGKEIDKNSFKKIW